DDVASVRGEWKYSLCFFDISAFPERFSVPTRRSSDLGMESVPVCFPLGERVPGTPYRVLRRIAQGGMGVVYEVEHVTLGRRFVLDRKSTRLNSSHVKISYAVFCLKKKK